MGVIATLGPLGLVASPGLGGLLVAGPGWRWIFYLNLPVCAVATLIARRSIPSQGRLSGLPVSLVGDAVLTAAAALGLLLALDRSRDGGWARPAPLLLLLLLLAVLAVAGWSRLSTAGPVRQALRERALSGQLVALVLGTTMVGAVYFLAPFLLQGVLGQSAAEAGAVLAMAVASQLGGQVADRVGPRAAATVGGVLILAGGLLLVPLDPHWNGPQVTWRLALLGLGSGFFAAPNLSAIMTATPRSLIGTVSAVSALARTFGFALGPAIAVGLWTGRQASARLRRCDPPSCWSLSCPCWPWLPCWRPHGAEHPCHRSPPWRATARPHATVADYLPTEG